MKKKRNFERCFEMAGRVLSVTITPTWAEVSLFCRDDCYGTFRVLRRVPRRDLPPNRDEAIDALLAPIRERCVNQPMSADDLAWAMRKRLVAKMGIKVTSEHVHFVPRGRGRAIPRSWVWALDLVTLWRVQRYLQSPQPHPALWGLRCWSFDGHILRSPTRNTPWPTSILQAHDLDASSIVEGKSGIHALHAPHAPTLHESLCAGCYVLATRDYLCPVWGLVRPYGRTVIGRKGWRAEFAQIVALMTQDPSYLPMLEERYGVLCFLFSAADDKEG